MPETQIPGGTSMANRIIVLAGCTGSGKTTYARQQFTNALVVSADHYFEDLAARSGKTYREVWDPSLLGTAHDLCRQSFAEAVKAGHPIVIVDNTNVRATDRQRFVNVGLEHGYEVEIHVLSPWLHGTPPLSHEQVAIYLRRCHQRNVHGVPLEAIAKHFHSLDLPSGVYRAGKPAQFLRPLEGCTGPSTGTTPS